MIEKREVLKMGAGREIDFLVAQKVMTKVNHKSLNPDPATEAAKHEKEIPQYSTNSYFAEKVVNKIREKYPLLLYGGDLWECQVFFPTGTVVSSGQTRSFPLAVCRAALLTVVEEKSQDKIKELGNKQKFKMFFLRRLKYAKER